jgi:glycosyltransferase involved in cell wall biosynthesis
MYDYDISVIIPTYKPGDYIYECLLSVKDQTFSKKTFEILIILNGDKEPYYTDINDFIKTILTTYHVQLIFSPDKGVSNARNIGIEKSKGKYLMFVDDDDIISKKYLQGMYAVARENIIPLSYTKAFKNDITDTFDYFITRAYEMNINNELSILNVRSFFSSPCCKLVNRHTIEDTRFDIRFKTGEDALFMFSISNKIKKIEFSGKDAVYYYRSRDGSLTTGKENRYTVKDCLMRIIAYTTIFLEKPFEYDFLFFITRILASLKLLILIQ